MRRLAPIACALGLLAAGPAAAQQDPILTCGLPDCSVLGDPFHGVPQAQKDRIIATALAIDAMDRSALTEMVALAWGQTGCPQPGDLRQDGSLIPLDPYYARIVDRLFADLGFRPEDRDIVEPGVYDVFWTAADDLFAQGRLVESEPHDGEWIPRACAGG